MKAYYSNNCISNCIKIIISNYRECRKGYNMRLFIKCLLPILCFCLFVTSSSACFTLNNDDAYTQVLYDENRINACRHPNPIKLGTSSYCRSVVGVSCYHDYVDTMLCQTCMAQYEVTSRVDGTFESSAHQIGKYIYMYMYCGICSEYLGYYQIELPN